MPYVDEASWPEICVEHEGSIVKVAEHLSSGRYDSALVYLDFAEANPGQFEVDMVLGSPDDAWLVFGRQRAAAKGAVICPDSAVARQAHPGLLTST